MTYSRRALLRAGMAGLATLGFAQTAFASQQENVDYIIARIRQTLADSLKTDAWQAKYTQVGRNIVDLKKTLLLGGKVSSNPVAAFGDQLDELLNERRTTVTFLAAMEQKIGKLRRKEAKGAIQDIGVEMIRRLTPKPGVLDALTAGGTHNEQVIRDDITRLKTFDEYLAKIHGYQNSIRPAVNDIVKRVNGLNPLLLAYGALAAVGFDGTYIGHFDGGGHGRIKLIVAGGAITGSISGSCTASPCGVDPMVGSLSGHIAKDGSFTTVLTGTLTDSSGFMGAIPFSGAVNGTIDGASASGSWNGKNRYGSPSGEFSASR